MHGNCGLALAKERVFPDAEGVKTKKMRAENHPQNV
jgi:hypothetical protein